MHSHYEKHHLACLNRSLRHPVALVLFAHSLYLTTFRFTYIHCLIAGLLERIRVHFSAINFYFRVELVTQTLEVLILPFYFISLTNPNNINFRVRSFVYISIFFNLNRFAICFISLLVKLLLYRLGLFLVSQI